MATHLPVIHGLKLTPKRGSPVGYHLDILIEAGGGGHCDPIVISYTLSNEIVQLLADTAREYCPDCPVIAITKTNVLVTQVRQQF